MKFEVPRGPADKPGGGGGDDNESELTPETTEKLKDLIHSEAVNALERFFKDRHEVGERMLGVEDEFSAEEFIETQFKFDAASDRERGITTPEPMSEGYAKAIQQYLDFLVEDGYLIHGEDDTYTLTEEGKALIPRKN